MKQINAHNLDKPKGVGRVKIQDGGSFHTGPIVVNWTKPKKNPADRQAVIDSLATNPGQ